MEDMYQLISTTLKTGKCPVCDTDISSDEMMREYFCTKDKSHFHLVIEFIQEGEEISAMLNGEPVPREVIKRIDW